MKYAFILIVLLGIGTGCKPRVIAGKELEDKLMETMKNYLDTTLKPGVKASVKNVAFYPVADKKLYICNFNVNMNFNNKDTSGIVVATISNDFTTVKRTQ